MCPERSSEGGNYVASESKTCTGSSSKLGIFMLILIYLVGLDIVNKTTNRKLALIVPFP